MLSGLSGALVGRQAWLRFTLWLATWQLPPTLSAHGALRLHSFYPSRCAGKLKQARRLFQDALRHEPANTHVLQALAVAEAR